MQLDRVGEIEPKHVYVGPIQAGIEVQRTIKTAEMSAFWLALRGLGASATIHTDNLGILNGVHRGEKKCIGPKAQEADIWIKIWKEMEKVGHLV